VNKEEIRKKLLADPNFVGDTDEEKKLVEEVKKEMAKGKVSKEELQTMIANAVSASMKPLQETQNKLMTAVTVPPAQDEDKINKEVTELMKAVYRKGGADRETAEKIMKGWGIQEKQLEGDEYLVHPQYVTQIHSILCDYGIARKKATILPINSCPVYIPTWLTLLELEFVGATHVKPVLSGEFGRETCECKKLAGIIPMHDQTIQDSTIDLVAFLRTELARAWALAEDRAVFFGNTAASVNGIDDVATVYYMTGTGATSILNLNFDHIKHLTESISECALEGAEFYMSRTVFNVLRNVKDSDGNYIYQKPSEKTPGMIWDYPYNVVPTILPGVSSDAPNTHFIWFGNLKHYIIGDRKSLAFKTSSEATIRYTDSEGEEQVIDLFQMDMTALRAVVRECFLPLFGDDAFAVLSTAQTAS